MKATPILGAILASLILSHALLPADDKGRVTPKGAEAPKAAPKPALPAGTPAEQVQALIAQHEKAMAACRKLYEAARSDEEKEKLEALYPDPRPVAELLVQIAEKSPKEQAAADALIWAFDKARSARAEAILLRDHLLNPKIGPVCLILRHQIGNAKALQSLRHVLAANSSRQAQAQAAVALAILLKSNAFVARTLQKADAKAAARWEKSLGKEDLAALKKADTAALEREAARLLESVTKTRAYAETTIPFGEARIKLGELAARELFEMRYLQPGKVAPDIVGEDIDGRPMKLSDFRGRVVLLDFWGFW